MPLALFALWAVIVCTKGVSGQPIFGWRAAERPVAHQAAGRSVDSEYRWGAALSDPTPSPLEHQQNIRGEQDEMHAALHDVCVATGEGDDRDTECHD